MAQLAVVLLALFGQMERIYILERAAHARAVATAKGRRIGRPVLVEPDKLAYAAHLRDTGHTITEIMARTGIAEPACTGTCHPDPPSSSPSPRHHAPRTTSRPGTSHAARPSQARRCTRPQPSSSRPSTRPTATGRRARPAPARPPHCASNGHAGPAYANQSSSSAPARACAPSTNTPHSCSRQRRTHQAATRQAARPPRRRRAPHRPPRDRAGTGPSRRLPRAARGPQVHRRGHPLAHLTDRQPRTAHPVLAPGRRRAATAARRGLGHPGHRPARHRPARRLPRHARAVQEQHQVHAADGRRLDPAGNRPTACWPTAWGHVTVLLDKVHDHSERDYYAAAAAQQGWSRNVLLNQIMNQLHRRAGTAPSNFPAELPAADSGASLG